MLLNYTPEGFENKGLNIEFLASTTNKIYTVRVIRIRTLIEICSLILGAIAGFVFIARLVKYCIEDIEYFKAKDRECDMLFGSPQIQLPRDARFEEEVKAAELRNIQSDRSINYSINDPNAHMEIPQSIDEVKDVKKKKSDYDNFDEEE